MYIPIEKDAIVEYSLLSDTSEPKTVFKLGFLTARQKAALAITSKKETKETEENSIWWFSIIKFGIRGWSNINTADGKPYEFKTQQTSVNGFGSFTTMADECFEIFTLDIVAELAAELYRLNYMNDDEKKSSLSPVTSGLTPALSTSRTKKK